MFTHNENISKASELWAVVAYRQLRRWVSPALDNLRVLHGPVTWITTLGVQIVVTIPSDARRSDIRRAGVITEYRIKG